MIRIPLPEEDTVLLLTPRWGELETPWQAAFLAGLVLVPLILMAVLYRYELRLIRGGKAILLLSIRLLVLLMLGFLVGFQPVLGHYHTEEKVGRVLIGLDISGSMEVKDRKRTALEKLTLARALKLFPNNSELESLIETWIRHYREKGDIEPIWVLPEEYPEDPPRRLKLADKRRNWHDQICREVDKLTRSDIARKILAGDGIDLLEQLEIKHQVEVAAFHQQIFPMGRDQMVANLPLDKVKGKTGLDLTNLNLPLQRALKKSGDGSVQAVILLTDGQHNDGPSPLLKGKELGEKNIPVFPVILGTRKPPGDIAIVQVKAPANVFKGLEAAVEVRFKVQNLPAQDVMVELGPPGKKPLQAKKMRHDGKDRIYTMNFSIPMKEVGTQVYEIRARPTDPATEEITQENNSSRAIVRVARDQARVLLIDGEARWEYHYLANALVRDRAIKLDRVVFVQPRIHQIDESKLENLGNPRLNLPAVSMDKKDDPLWSYDCIILGDVSPEHLPPVDRERLVRYVSDRGGALVFLAGKRYMPLSYLKGSGGRQLPEDPLMKLLPVRSPTPLRPKTGFSLELTPAGAGVSFLQLEGDIKENARFWHNLPRHYWGLVGEEKPGAVALVVPAAPSSPPSGKPSGLIVQQSFGLGRVLFIGLESTWRWRFRVGDLYHHRFWGQVIRWAASDQLLPGGNHLVRFGSREPVYRQGQEVAIAARLSEKIPPLSPKSIARARIFRFEPKGKENPVALVPLAAGPFQPRLLAGKIRDLVPGQYRIELDIPELKSQLRLPPEPREEADPGGDTFSIIPVDSREMIDLAANWDLAEALANQSKGRVFTPENVSALVHLLNRNMVKVENRQEQRPWQDPPQVWITLGIFLTLLTLEWTVRKWVGLP